MLIFTAKIRLIVQTTKNPTKNFISGPDPNIKFFDRRDRPYLLTGHDPSRRFLDINQIFLVFIIKKCIKNLQISFKLCNFALEINIFKRKK